MAKPSGEPDFTPDMRSVKLVIADEEPAFRDSIRKVLEPQRRIAIVGEAHDVESIVTLVIRESPQILLLDYGVRVKLEAHGMSERCGFPDAVRHIITLAAPEKTKIIDSFRLGAKGIILKESPARTWWRGIGAVLRGQYWLGNEPLAALVQAIRESPSHRAQLAQHFGLTPREIEIVQRIADGRSNKEVGEDCSIRERTVKHHLTNIFGKVGVSSRLELALFAREHQIITRPRSAPSHGSPARAQVQAERQRLRSADEPDSASMDKARNEA